jgi:DNA repair protein RadC
MQPDQEQPRTTTRSTGPLSSLVSPAIQLVETRLVLPPPAASVEVTTPYQCAALAHSIIGGSDREEFLVLLLNARHRVTHANRVAIGTLSATTVHPREVFKGAILANAAAVIVAHNHPSGDPSPSLDDIKVTRRLKVAGELLGIELLDALVVTATGYFYSSVSTTVEKLSGVLGGPR